MSISALSAFSASCYAAYDLRPLEIAFRETAQSLETAMENLALDDIQENSQKLNTIIEQMRDKRLSYIDKYRDQATRLSEQAAAVLSAHMPPSVENDGMPDLESQDAFVQCEHWLKLAKNGESPTSILAKITHAEIKAFIAVQLAHHLLPLQEEQALRILKNYVTHPISSTFYNQVFGHQKPEKLEVFSIHPQLATLFANRLLEVQNANAHIYSLLPQDIKGTREALCHKRGTDLNLMLQYIPNLANLYMEDLSKHQEEQLLQAEHQIAFASDWPELENGDSLHEINQLRQFLQARHLMRLPVQENYWDRLQPKLRAIMQELYVGKMPHIEFPPQNNPTAVPTSFLSSRDVANMASVNHDWNLALQSLVLPSFQEEVESELLYFADRQAQFYTMGTAAVTPLANIPCRYVQLTSYGPSAARQAIQTALKQTMKDELGAKKTQLLSHASYPAKPFQHLRLIENFYLRPQLDDESLLETHSLPFLKTLLKDDPEWACAVVNKKAMSDPTLLLLWTGMIENIRDADFILPRILNPHIRSTVAIQVAGKILKSGEEPEEVLLLLNKYRYKSSTVASLCSMAVESIRSVIWSMRSVDECDQ